MNKLKCELNAPQSLRVVRLHNPDGVVRYPFTSITALQELAG